MCHINEPEKVACAVNPKFLDACAAYFNCWIAHSVLALGFPLTESGAKQLLVSAYVNEVINRSNNADVVTFVKQELSARGRIIADEV